MQRDTLRKMSKIPWLLSLLTVMVACSAPAMHSYAVKVSSMPNGSVSGPAAPLSSKTVAIHRFRGDKAYDQQRIVYRQTNNEVGFYEYHLWTNPPTDLARQSVMMQLISGGYFKNAVEYREAPQADYALTGRVLSFEEVDKAGGVFASVRLELTLMDNKTAAQLWSGSGEAELPVQTRTVPAVVEALDSALLQSTQQAVKGLGDFLRQNQTTH